MFDSSLSSLGAKVVVASSGDENQPPENITDGNAKTFWMSTGMFPQEFIIRFADNTNISTVTVDSYNATYREQFGVQYLAQGHFGVHTGGGGGGGGAGHRPTALPPEPQPTQVKHLKIEKNTSQNASQFESVTEKEFEHTEGCLQSNSISLNGSSATHLRFIITSGYDHFVSVHSISIQN